MDPRVDSIYSLCEGRLNWDNMVPTVIAIAKEVEQLKELKGPEKLDLLQKVIKFGLKNSDLSVSKKESILHYVDIFVPIVAQAIILASKSPIVQRVETACVGCWAKK